MTSVSELDLDLDVFQGPFDLLLAVLLREEISLAEVPLGEIVVAYVDHIGEDGSRSGPRDRHRVPRPDRGALRAQVAAAAAAARTATRSSGPEEAADELLARMLEYRRYSEAAQDAHRAAASAREGSSTARRRLPPELRRAALDAATQVYEPDRVGVALGDLLTIPPPPDTRHIRTTVTLQRRLGVIRDLLRSRKTLDFDEAFGGEDRFTQAVTLFALLELYRRGEATWTQTETFGRIEVHAQ